ncbi:putative inner membrane protein [Azoarcus sp. CIB]|uniref:YqaA family protein n=1 Tax=Aromatoleum sp. (strain CIB) TaxID=198107 RepID=UPI00067C24F6|nr:YqaA family protein [Azoarcus sp. CIB]AKU14171.1 putative inner membrane protein [Azoarcus sp. CIB]
MSVLSLLDPGPDAGLVALFVSSFLSATLLPGGSELVLAGVLSLRPEQLVPALTLATLGNTLGGMSTWGLARLLPRRADTTRLDWVRRHGAPVLLLSWAPVVGDALCAAAGWLRLPWLPCLLWMGVGKLLRYALIAFSVT